MNLNLVSLNLFLMQINFGKAARSDFVASWGNPELGVTVLLAQLRGMAIPL